MAEGNASNEPTLVERWLHDQQQWQRTLLAYLDSAVKNDDFLVHLGNALRGSLLAGKPYPTEAAAGATSAHETVADDRLDRVLFALHQLQGQLEDLRMTLDEIRHGQESGRNGQSPDSSPSGRSPKAASSTETPPARTRRTRAATTSSKIRKRKPRRRKVSR